jgi:hypothetical protein
MDKKTRKKLIDNFVEFVVNSPETDLEDVSEWLQKNGFTKTATGAVLAAFVQGYLFGLAMHPAGKEAKAE